METAMINSVNAQQINKNQQNQTIETKNTQQPQVMENVEDREAFENAVANLSEKTGLSSDKYMHAVNGSISPETVECLKSMTPQEVSAWAEAGKKILGLLAMAGPMLVHAIDYIIEKVKDIQNSKPAPQAEPIAKENPKTEETPELDVAA